MTHYTVELTRAAEKQLQHIDSHDRLRIVAALAALGDDPRPPGCITLRGRPGYRIRVGDYRVVYTIEAQRVTVVVLAIGHRREVYR